MAWEEEYTFIDLLRWYDLSELDLRRFFDAARQLLDVFERQTGPLLWTPPKSKSRGKEKRRREGRRGY